MADTHGFELIIQASKSLVVKALKGAWKSAECPDQPDDTGRIPEFMDIPAVGNIGGFPIVDGHVQIPQAELNAEFAPDINGIELILGLNIQIVIGNPPVPSAGLLNFHVVLHAKSPVGKLPDTQDVGILLKDIKRPDVWAVLDSGHPLDNSLNEIIQDFIHKSYENEEIPHFITQNGVSFLIGTMNTSTQIFDDESNPARRITTSFPVPTTLELSIPIYLRMFAFVPNPVGPINIASPMGIETRIIIKAPFEKQPTKYAARFDLVTDADISIGPITGPGADIAGNPNEAANYNTNKATMSSFGQDLDVLLSNQLKTRGVSFANALGLKEFTIPSTAEIETQIADLFFAELTKRNYLGIWTPTASNDQFQVDTVDPKVMPDSFNIALNNTGAGDLNAITNFIPATMEFAIAMSRPSLDEKIQKAVADGGFNKFPKRFKEDGKDVDLNSLNVSVIDHAIRLEGTVTVIDAILGSIDVDASFTTDVGLHWEPNGALDISGFQNMKHHIIGDPDVDVDEGIAFWIVAIILAVISFGFGGVLVGIISIIVILIVKAIVENIGSDSLVNGVTGAIDGITAWPPKLARIGRVKAVFFDPVDISVTGLVIAGQVEVISSCETTQVVPATTAGKYTIPAAVDLELKALKIYNLAEFTWNPGDGSASQLLKTIYHKYDNSGIYIAKHKVLVTEYGGAESRHFAAVRVTNVPAVVDAGPDITVNEGEVVSLEAYFEDIEYLDTHWSVWNFGDNQPPQLGMVEEENVKPKATGKSKVQHAWCDNGVYYVSVQVIDNNGGVGTATKKVTVLNVDPEVTTPEKIYAYPCSPITLVAKFKDMGWCDTHTATWRFGDCSVVKMAIVEETNSPPAAKGTATASNTYSKCGSYYAECIVTDDDGGVGTSDTVVEVIDLKNGYFNDGFTFNPLGKTANYWKPFTLNTGFALGTLVGAPQEIFFCEKCHVYDGHSSQRIVGTPGSLSGLYQVIGANPGWVYQIEVMYLLKNKSGIAGLGIDPYGDTDPSSANIIWSKGNIEQEWSHLLQRACAKSDSITVFIAVQGGERELTECCFDAAKLTAMQNISCTRVEENLPPEKRICIDFKGINEQEDLPPKWDYKGLTFITMSGQPNRITTIFPPGYLPSLEIRRGLIIDFRQAVTDLKMEFSYSNKLYVMTAATDNQKGLIKGTYELVNPVTSIAIEGNSITNIQILIKGEGALTSLCYRKSTMNQSLNQTFLKPARRSGNE